MSNQTPKHAQLVPLSIESEDPVPKEHLPSYLTPFIGRQDLIASVTEQFSRPEVRLITLTGPGGVGKTRLALAFADVVVNEFSDGVAFVDLSLVRDIEHVIPAISYALGIRDVASAVELADQLALVLANRQMLLVLDNFEHVTAAAPAIGDLLQACPAMKVLATSRAALGLSGEQIVPVPPLALPGRSQLDDLTALAQVESIALFIRRAQAADPTFTLTADNADPIAQICSRLDGLPLSLELAAARIKMLTPRTLVALLERRLRVLSGGRRDAPSRHQTLRETLTWSYELLAPDEQELFRQLGVFTGGFTLEAIETMKRVLAVRTDRTGHDSSALDRSEARDRAVLDVLESLVTQSLVRYVEPFDSEQRFTTLETIREFALDQLEALGEIVRTRQAHAMYFLDFAAQSESELIGPNQTWWLDRLELDHDNFREALTWLLGHDPSSALRLSGAMWRFWWIHGHLVEGRRWLEKSLATGVGAPAERAKALCAAGGLALEQGDYATAETQLTASLRNFRRANDKSGEALALNDLGLLSRDKGDFTKARAFYEEALDLRRAINDGRGIAIALCNLGVVAGIQGDYDLAEAPLAEAASTFRALNDPFALSAVLTMQADLAGRRGDYERAVQIADEAIELARHLGDPSATAIALITKGDNQREQGSADSAAQQYEEALNLFRAASHHRGEAGALCGLGTLALDRDDIGQALTLLADTLRLLGPTGDQEQVACALEEVARAAVHVGEFERAARMYGAIAQLREVMGVPRTVGRQVVHADFVADARTKLDPRAYDSAEAVGRTLPLEQVILEAIDFAAQPPALDGPGVSISTERTMHRTTVGLTPRELEVLRLLAAGQTNQEIASTLSISVATTKTHVVRILSKLDLRSRAAAAGFAHRNGLI